MNLLNYQNIHMVGIKGVGMTALTQVLKDNGFNVVGSDIAEVFITDEVLRKLKIKYYNCFDQKNLSRDTDLLIYSTAYKKNNPEIKEAIKRKISIISYPEALGLLLQDKYGIAITGSHGKTTTTAMIGWILIQSNLKPTVIVGSKISNLDTNAYSGDGNYVVIEADEYQNKFQYYDPKMLVITNIDYDHPDYFKTKIAYKNVFKQFVDKVAKRAGVVVGCGDDKEVVSIVKRLKSQGLTYGFDKSNVWRAENVCQNARNTTFTLLKNNLQLGKITILLHGEHNVLNALASIATVYSLDISLSVIKKALRLFIGTSRRMEKVGAKKGVLIYDDYAHHPTEIKATLSALKDRHPKQRIWAVFHPHTFTRTKVFLTMFAQSFSGIYKVIVLDIYGSAREKGGTIHSKDLVKKINTYTNNAIYIQSKEEAVSFLQQNAIAPDVIITLGAGDVWKVGKSLLGA